MKRLYWSHISMVRKCPLRYLWYKGHPDHDLGAGLGKPKPLAFEERPSEHFKLMGSVLSKVVEVMYNDRLLENPKECLSKLTEVAQQEFEKLEQTHHIMWTYLTREEAMKICLDGVRNFLEIVKEHKMISKSYAQSELSMTPQINKSLKVCGIADLVYRDLDGKLWILDGKNASTPMKYEDEDQLRWYALCFRLEYGIMPDKLGFFYFRYPKSNPPKKNPDPSSEWTGLVEVSLTEDDIRRLGNEAIETYRLIERGVFEANPVPKNCSFCEFENVCEARQEQKRLNAAKRKPKEPKKYDNYKTFTLGGGKL